MLRSLRLGEADRVLHLYTLSQGRIGAVAKGVRRTKSRFGARLEPLSHVELLLHHGRGELQTVTGVDLIRSHHAAREDSYRLNVGLVGAEAMLRLFTETEGNSRAFTALTRFLDTLDVLPPRAGQRPALDPLALSFQLKLLWLAGYMPHLATCAECGGDPPLVGLLPARRRGGLQGVRATGGDPALAGGVRGPRRPPAPAARRRGGRGAQRPRGARDAACHRGVVRGARRLPAPHAVGLTIALAMRPLPQP